MGIGRHHERTLVAQQIGDAPGVGDTSVVKLSVRNKSTTAGISTLKIAHQFSQAHPSMTPETLWFSACAALIVGMWSTKPASRACSPRGHHSCRLLCGRGSWVTGCGRCWHMTARSTWLWLWLGEIALRLQQILWSSSTPWWNTYGPSWCYPLIPIHYIFTTTNRWPYLTIMNLVGGIICC